VGRPSEEEIKAYVIADNELSENADQRLLASAL
jgi:hypothetical protein